MSEYLSVDAELNLFLQPPPSSRCSSSVNSVVFQSKGWSETSSVWPPPSWFIAGLRAPSDSKPDESWGKPELL